MESLKRSLMLLRPYGIRTETGKIGGTLKLQASAGGISLSLKTDCLSQADYFLYLFLASGKELYAGDVTDGVLNTLLTGVPLENISGAAVVQRNRANFDFVLRSTGPDWQTLISRFRAAHNPQPAVWPAAEAAPRVQAANQTIRREPEAVAYEHIPEINKTENEVSIDNIENIKNMVQEGFEEQETMSISPGVEETECDGCPHALRETKVNPFPTVFPNSEWVKISYPGPAGWWHYISGKIYKGGIVTAKALGVPGEYGMAPPIWLEGFGTYMRCVTGDARGYWLMFQDAETGEVLDMGLSPHGA